MLGLLASPGWSAPKAVAHEGHEHAEPAAPPAAHAHKAPHGGTVQDLGKVHAELVARSDRLAVYLYDAAMAPLSARGASGKAILQISGRKKQTVALAPVTGDRLEGQAALTGAKAFVAVITLTLEGKRYTGRFKARP